jgi:ribosome biogenesis GTPase
MSSSPSSSSTTDADAPHLDGVITRSTGSWYDVRVDDGHVVPSRVRGKFRLKDDDVTNPVAVGDHVTIRYNEDDETGFIVDIHERRNALSRRAAGRRAEETHVIVANIDRAWAVQSMRLPRLNLGFVDRFLVSADLHDIPAGLIINKVDLMREDDPERLAEIRDIYEDLGHPVLCTSATEGDGLDDVQDAFQDQVNAITGPSGAGKSTLLNAIEPALDIETSAVSEKTRKGTHTTTFAELHPLSFGGYVVDTPGIREFGILEMHPADLAHFFVEFIPFLDDCKFDDCTHDHEPGCAVKDAVDGDIHAWRYDSYLSILHSLQTGQEGTGR